VVSGSKRRKVPTLAGTSSPSTRQTPEPATTRLISSWPVPGLVVLVPGRVRRDLEPVDPERLEAELATDETDSAARPGGLDLLDVDDAVPHQSLR
jgi:hypothetical protein